MMGKVFHVRFFEILTISIVKHRSHGQKFVVAQNALEYLDFLIQR